MESEHIPSPSIWRVARCLVAGLVLGTILGFVLGWIYWVQRRTGAGAARGLASVEGERVTLRPVPRAVEGVSPEPDDLTRIEGIGPKISNLLADEGVVTYQQLAGSDPGDLKEILREAGLHFADPGTWSEQAALAAVGAWETLEELQEELSAGKRAE